MSEPELPTKIVARNRREYLDKVKEALKKNYPEGREVNVTQFGEKYGVRPSNVKAAISELETENYRLIVPPIVSSVVGKR